MDEVIEGAIAYLNGIFPLSPACKEYLRRVIKKKTVKKGSYLLRPGEVCENMYLIYKGLLVCSYDLGKQEVPDWFFWDMDACVSVGSYYDQTASEDYIRAEEDCELLYITHDELEYMYRTFLEFNYVGRVLTIKYLKIFHKHARNMRKLEAADRYKFLLGWWPELIQRVPVGLVAGWLGMDPSTLSRARSGLNK